jgi:hypothetical protein
MIGMALPAPWLFVYPAFLWIDAYEQKNSRRTYFKAGKNAAGKSIGALITF